MKCFICEKSFENNLGSITVDNGKTKTTYSACAKCREDIQSYLKYDKKQDHVMNNLEKEVEKGGYLR